MPSALWEPGDIPCTTMTVAPVATDGTSYNGFVARLSRQDTSQQDNEKDHIHSDAQEDDDDTGNDNDDLCEADEADDGDGDRDKSECRSDGSDEIEYVGLLSSNTRV